MVDAAILSSIEAEIQKIEPDEYSYVAADQQRSHESRITQVLERMTASMVEADRRRVISEFRGLGPVEHLMESEDISEIMLISPQNIWVERKGKLEKIGDSFCSDLSYRNSIERLCEASRSQVTVERPSGQGHVRGYRVQVIGQELTKTFPSICLRRHPDNPWTLERLKAAQWSTEAQVAVIRRWINECRNFLVVGPTGSGKTSVTNACLQELPPSERVLILEDTQELCIPNQASQRLMTREDPQRLLPDITLTDLVRQALRMRPDRLIVGEVRGGEAKDFLLALSTGHAGSFGTLHASQPHQALIRLEMLVQMGAPNWNIQAIRRLIQLSLQGIVLVTRDRSGSRRLEGLYEISSLEESGFLVEQIA